MNDRYSRHFHALWLTVMLALFATLFLLWSGIASGQNVQLSPGPVLLTSPPTISPDSQWAVYVDAAGLWSVPLHGGAPVALMTLLPGRQLFGAAQITPQSDLVVYISDRDTLGKPELHSVSIMGGPVTRISKDMAADRQVRDFALSPTSQRVYFAADSDTNNKIELYSASVAGGPQTKLNAAISTEHDIFAYAASSLDRVVYRVGRSSVGQYELWSVPGDGRASQARRISKYPMVTGGSANEFIITPDGEGVIYRADALENGRFDLFSVTIGGGVSVRLDLNDGRSVRGDFLVDDSGVRYSYSATEWWSVSITGGASIPIPPPMPEPVRSPDGNWIVYGAGVGLWSSGPGDVHRLVSCAGQSVTATFLASPAYSVSPDSKRVVYIAGNEVWTSPITGAVCLIFKDSFESGNLEGWR